MTQQRRQTILAIWIQLSLVQKLEVISLTIGLLTVLNCGVVKIIDCIKIDSDVQVISEESLKLEFDGIDLKLKRLFRFSNNGYGQGAVKNIDAKLRERKTGKIIGFFVSTGYLEIPVSKEKPIEQEIIFRLKDDLELVQLAPNAEYVLEVTFNLENEKWFSFDHIKVTEKTNFKISETKLEILIGGNQNNCAEVTLNTSNNKN